MKESLFIITLLIPGRNAPGKDIDVYLRLLVDELKELWKDGVRIFDSDKNEYFQMYAALLWTINDFPAYKNISGWSIKGYMACPVCNKDILSSQIRSKTCYIGHRCFLTNNNSMLRSKQFNIF